MAALFLTFNLALVSANLALTLRIRRDLRAIRAGLDPEDPPAPPRIVENRAIEHRTLISQRRLSPGQGVEWEASCISCPWRSGWTGERALAGRLGSEHEAGRR